MSRKGTEVCRRTETLTTIRGETEAQPRKVRSDPLCQTGAVTATGKVKCDGFEQDSAVSDDRTIIEEWYELSEGSAGWQLWTQVGARPEILINQSRQARYRASTVLLT